VVFFYVVVDEIQGFMRTVLLFKFFKLREELGLVSNNVCGSDEKERSTAYLNSILFLFASSDYIWFYPCKGDEFYSLILVLSFLVDLREML